MIRKRIISAISGNVLMQAINAIIQIAGIPLLLKFWGIHYYGEWLLLFTIPSYIAMSDLGLGSSTTSELSMLVEARREVEAKSILRNTFWFILIVGGIPFLLLMCSLFILPWYDWLNFSSIPTNEFKPAFIYLLLYIYLALFLTIPLGYYRVRQIYHRERYISSFFRVFEFCAVVLAVFAGYKVVMVAFIYFIVRLLNLLYVLFDLTRRFDSFRLLPFGFQYREIKHLLKPGLSAMTIYLGQNFMVQGLVSIIGIGLGSAQVVVFSTARTLVNVVKQVVGIINLSVTSEFSYAYGAGDLTLLRRIFRLTSNGNVLTAFIFLAGLYYFGHQVVAIWTGGRIDVQEPFFTIVLIGAFFSTFWNTHLVLLVSTNMLGRTGIWFLVSASVLLVINAIWINYYGLTGVAVTILIFEVLMMAIMFFGTRAILRNGLEKHTQVI